jgi:uncharacterized protein
MNNEHHKINYIEIPATDLKIVKTFFEYVFDWVFTDYGSDYASFSNAGIKGGFYQSELKSRVENGAVLLVFYSAELKLTMNKINQSGGKVSKPIFDFPGGCRFHFLDPAGNEYGVWSESK